MDIDVAVVEDVWGEPFESLASRRSVFRDPDVWSEPERLPATVADARALVVRNQSQVRIARLLCDDIEAVLDGKEAADDVVGARRQKESRP